MIKFNRFLPAIVAGLVSFLISYQSIHASESDESKIKELVSKLTLEMDFSKLSTDLPALESNLLSFDFHSEYRKSDSSFPPLEDYESGIAEAFQTEIVLSKSTDKNPIIASYGAGPCIIFAGYDSEKKVGFPTHISTPKEIMFGQDGRGEEIAWNIHKILGKEKGNLKLYITGGYEGQSNATLAAIKDWIKTYSWVADMTIVHEDKLGSGIESKSLALDTRTGLVSTYNPLSNYKHRELDEVTEMQMLMSAFIPKMTVAYFPESD